MEETATSVVCDYETPVIILKKEDDSEVTMDPLDTTAESADPSSSGCESVTGAERENQVRVFVTLLTVRVLMKSDTLKNHSQEEWVTHTKRLINQAMEGLTVTEGFCPDTKHTKKVCKAVLKDLHKKFCSRQQLESMILLQDPAVDATVVQSLQTHVAALSAQLAKKALQPRTKWTDVLQGIACALGLVGMLLIPFIL